MILETEVVSNNNIVLFENEELGQVRVAVDENNEPLFCLSDICKILDIQNTTDVKNTILREFELSRLNLHSFDTGFGIKEFTMIDEAQLYFILMRSDKPNAKPFRMWVTKEVLPSIRKKGYYGSINKDFHPDYDIVKKQNDILNEMVCTQNNTIYNLKEAIKVLNTSVQTLKEINRFKSNENVKKERDANDNPYEFYQDLRKLVNTLASKANGDYRNIWKDVYLELANNFNIKKRVQVDDIKKDKTYLLHLIDYLKRKIECEVI
ncbi:hypothetical protein AJ935_01960 [Campylobacter sp. BCW_6876]|nr:hypothetical protein AJ935_01960 [Campylobacter sp. BCW_6876]